MWISVASVGLSAGAPCARSWPSPACDRTLFAFVHLRLHDGRIFAARLSGASPTEWRQTTLRHRVFARAMALSRAPWPVHLHSPARGPRQFRPCPSPSSASSICYETLLCPQCRVWVILRRSAPTPRPGFLSFLFPHMGKHRWGVRLEASTPRNEHQHLDYVCGCSCFLINSSVCVLTAALPICALPSGGA